MPNFSSKLKEKYVKLYEKIQEYVVNHNYDLAFELIDKFKDENYLSVINDTTLDQLLLYVKSSEKDYKQLLKVKKCKTKDLINYIYDGKEFNIEILDYAIKRMKEENVNYTSDIIRLISLPKVSQNYRFQIIKFLKARDIEFEPFDLINEFGETIHIEYEKVESCWLMCEDMRSGYYKDVYDLISQATFKEPSLLYIAEHLISRIMEKNFGMPDKATKDQLAKNIAEYVIKIMKKDLKN